MLTTFSENVTVERLVQPLNTLPKDVTLVGATKYGDIDDFKNNIWIEMFEEASKKEKEDNVSDLIPFWGLRDPEGLEGMEDRDMIKIERILPLYPFSIDEERYKRLIRILSVYRLTLGQARQEELVDSILEDGKLHNLDEFINLSPYYKESIK